MTSTQDETPRKGRRELYGSPDESQEDNMCTECPEVKIETEADYRWWKTRADILIGKGREHGLSRDEEKQLKEIFLAMNAYVGLL